MIESGFLKTIDDLTEFLAGYPLGVEAREELYDIAEFLEKERTIFKVRVFDYETFAYANIIVIDDYREQFVFSSDEDEGDEGRYIYNCTTQMFYDELVYEKSGEVTNTILGIVKTEYDNIVTFRIDLRKWDD